MHIKQILMLVLGLSIVALSHAKVYEWVDEKGTKHYGDKVPDKYKKQSKTLDIKQNDTSFGNDKQSTPKPAPLVKPQQTQPVVTETPQLNDVPNVSTNSRDNCEKQIQEYKKSQDCFAPFVIVGGGVKPEAFKYCKEIKQPTCTGR
ncbi:MAG: DUF4124 domain-containing protein [Methylotenera sp.]|nr:MAG: DUF4124 domain-containing protein [Methylotenera sp.]PPD18338.1 MAG: DUF4124 domain-containing protein [Methylotenera sp.]